MAKHSPILVTGSGRSGTTLVMYLLEAIGAVMSPDMIPASPQNPDGGREDSELFRLHGDLHRSFYSNTYLPLPVNWLEHKAIAKARVTLKKVLSDRLGLNPDRPWAVKDPKLSFFIPIWTQVLNAIKVVPVHVLCVRHPESMARSMVAQYGRSPEESMMTWMLRNAYALRHTGGNCLVIHYEDWEQDGATQLSRLAEHAGLTTAFEHKTPSEILDNIFKPALNRAGFVRTKEITNPAVRRLYEVLKAVPGGSIAGRESAIAAEECLAEIEQFRGMALIAQRALEQADAFKQKQQLQSDSSRKAAENCSFEKCKHQLEGASAQIASTEVTVQELKKHISQKTAEIDQVNFLYEHLQGESEKINTVNRSMAAHIHFLESKLLELREQPQSTVGPNPSQDPEV